MRTRARGLITRHPENPILVPEDVPYPVETVHNAGAALLDLEDPTRVLGVADDWVLAPEDPWELTGYVHNVVFTCGAVPEDDGTLRLYWGGADRVICTGTARIDDLVALCLERPRPALGGD